MTESKAVKVVLDTVEKLDEWDKGLDSWNDWALLPKSGAIEPIEGSFALTLSGEAAMHLWRKGKEAWNAWVKRNPEAGIDFVGQEFEPNKQLFAEIPVIDFQYFKFPCGFVNFANSKFQNGLIEFHRAKFGSGRASFDGAKFGTGDVNFTSANFGEGDVSFNRANFGKGNVSFMNANFGKGNVSFLHVNFGNGFVSFAGAVFGNGKVKFGLAKFNDGDVYFNDAKFGDSDVDFQNASFGSGSVSLPNVTFAGTAHLDDLINLGNCAQFSFEGCAFEKLFTFSLAENKDGTAGRMGCPLDLRRTAMKHDVVVQDIRCDFALEPRPNWKSILHAYWTGMPHGAEPHSPWLDRSGNKEDSQSFRKLKELAVSNRNHTKALEFHALEIQSARGHYDGAFKNWGMSFWQLLYWGLSNYGRSVFLPFAWIVGTLFTFAAIFCAFATEKAASFWDGFIFSAANMFAFIPIGRTGREQSTKALFCDDVPTSILIASGGQTLLSIVLLFLLGLGLRNMFRI